MATITMKSLFEAGVHLGHKTERWHPKMKPYIYGAHAGIYIIDLRQTMERLQAAYDTVYNTAANGGSILFVGTKFQAREIIAAEAARSSNPFVNLRWLGGMMTNLNTVKQSISKLRKIEDVAGPDKNYPGVIKKEAVRMEKSRVKLESVLGGIRDVKRTPSLMFIIDTQRESIAIQEAKKLGIPVVAVVDTNCDPREIDFVIPGNDDSVHCIELFTKVIATAAVEGRKVFEKKSAVKVDKKTAAPAAKKAAPAAKKPAAAAKAAPKAAAPKAAPAAPKAELKAAPKAEPKADAKAETTEEPKA